MLIGGFARPRFLNAPSSACDHFESLIARFDETARIYTTERHSRSRNSAKVHQNFSASAWKLVDARYSAARCVRVCVCHDYDASYAEPERVIALNVTLQKFRIFLNSVNAPCMKRGNSKEAKWHAQLRYSSLRINYRFSLCHVYYPFSNAITSGNVCPWLNGPSIYYYIAVLRQSTQL